MRTHAILLGLLLTGLPLATLAPVADAFDWCVEGTRKDCDSHIVCIGRSWSQWYGETCTVGVERPCPYDCHLLP